MFSYVALTKLSDMFSFDKAAYSYYGSETTPPCTEDTLWIVFRTPRNLSLSQFDFLLYQLVKNKSDEKRYDGNETNPNNLFGNKREINYYDSNKRGFIHYMRNALEKVDIDSDLNSQISKPTA